MAPKKKAEGKSPKSASKPTAIRDGDPDGLPAALQNVNASHYTDLQASLGVIRGDPILGQVEKEKPLAMNRGGMAVHSSV